VLLVVSQKNKLVERATGNLQTVTAVSANYLNVYDILNADVIVFEQAALTTATEWLSKETK
jgi:ribosomal protein L4